MLIKHFTSNLPKFLVQQERKRLKQTDRLGQKINKYYSLSNVGIQNNNFFFKKIQIFGCGSTNVKRNPCTQPHLRGPFDIAWQGRNYKGMAPVNFLKSHFLF